MAIFTTTTYPIGHLVSAIELGKIGLPELQRPFVWPNPKVRDLFDSLYKGYPTGFLLFWETGADTALKAIGVAKAQIPTLAIVDGQQRLTSLYAVMKGAEVLRADFRRERIRIAFSPLLERFAVADAANAKDKAYIPDITKLWDQETDIFQFVDDYMTGLAATRDLSTPEQQTIKKAITRLLKLPDYSFTALTLSTQTTPEVVADVFVLINGQGQKLNQADFILTLMSVHWDEGRAELETFARAAATPSDDKPSPWNPYIKPSPDQMLRVTVALALRRGQLAAVYAALRGLDVKTGVEDPERREAQFARMREAQAHVVSLTNWHHFLGALPLAGYRASTMVSSETAILYAYAIYLIGLRDHGIGKDVMRQAVAEFLSMALLTGRYSGATESTFNADLSALSGAASADGYLARLRDLSSAVLTKDFWEITLPAQLATSGARTPTLLAYWAALVRLDARALYSQAKIGHLVDAAVHGTKAAIDRHHLFPRAHLKAQGIGETKAVNQIANFAFVEWPLNIEIGKQPPASYAPAREAQLAPSDRADTHFWHALPAGWWGLGYDEFLKSRRELMARVIERAWRSLRGEEPSTPPPVTVAELIAGGETDAVEFKSSLRVNLHTGQPDPKMELAVLKTVAAFLNAKGGTLLVGVADDGRPLGLAADGFPSEDKMALHLANLIDGRLGNVFRPYVHPRFDDQGDARVLVVRCEAGPRPAFVQDGAAQRFYVRGGNATAELAGPDVTDYVGQRFR